ncbi:MAG: MATE family efflux transporter [Lachnospiraceae bacterium]|nr:MATE family efflux transporter [Lachnospiraceae bacterium]
MQSHADSRLGTEKISKLMVQLALPSVLAQVVNVLYNIVDRIYIGRIPNVGAAALTGVGVTFPIISIIAAFSGFSSGGGAPLASIALGQNQKERAEKILGNCTTMLLCFSAVLITFFLLFQEPLLYLFGASSNTIGYSSTYITIYLAGTFFVQLAVGLNTFISCQGQARTAMLSVLIGAVVNIVLDPIFIFIFDMGVAGAACATVISQALSAAWVLRFLTSDKSVIRLRISRMKPNKSLLKSIMALGISPFIMQSTESAIIIVMNHGLQVYGGDLYVGSMTILQSVTQLIFVPVSGFTNGVQPIISYNFGAGSFDRVKQTIKRMISITFCVTFLYVLTAMLFPGVFAGLFTTDPELLALVKKVLPVFIAGMLVFGLQSGIQSSFLGLGQAKVSLFIALLRKVFLLIPLALILPRFFGVMGVYYAEPVADVLSVTTAVTLFLLNIRKILSKETLAKVTDSED